jgi:hypothetical protein
LLDFPNKLMSFFVQLAVAVRKHLDLTHAEKLCGGICFLSPKVRGNRAMLDKSLQTLRENQEVDGRLASVRQPMDEAPSTKLDIVGVSTDGQHPCPKLWNRHTFASRRLTK